jgi:hypothetical protein
MSSPLLRLPRELRDEIIRYTFDGYDQERLHVSRHHFVLEQVVTPPIGALPPISTVSQQLYLQATPYFLTLVTPISTNYATTCWIRKWLATFPSDLGYRSIQQLAFRNFHGPGQARGYELIALCPRLRHLSIMFGDEHSDSGTILSLSIRSHSSSVNANESLDNIILIHQIHRILEIPNLELLEFGFHDWEHQISYGRAAQIKEWLQVKFRAKGKDVYVVCKQMQWHGRYSLEDVDEIAERWYLHSRV